MSGDWTGSSADLRALVREVLRDAVPKGDVQEVPATAPAQVTAPAVVEPISIRSDADLAAFVQRVLDAAATLSIESAGVFMSDARALSRRSRIE